MKAEKDADYYVEAAIKAIAKEAMLMDRQRIQQELERLAELRGDNTLPLEDAVSVAHHELPLGGRRGTKI